MASAEPRVYSKRKGAQRPPAGAVLVDRTTPHGNQFVIGKDGTRGECVELHRDWIMDPEQATYRERVRRELRGKDLVCWCAPKPCHANVLLEIANGR